jgi:hypothetical protein
MELQQTNLIHLGYSPSVLSLARDEIPDRGLRFLGDGVDELE